MFTRRYFSQTFRIAVIQGDGIGKEVVPQGIKVLKYLENKLGNNKIKFEYIDMNAGWETFEKTGNALPSETLKLIKTCHGGIFGAVQSPSHKVAGYSSPIVALRNQLDLYANIRPCISIPNVDQVNKSRISKPIPGVNMLIIRENTECLYIKKEKLSEDGNTAIAERKITRKASERIARVAFEMALARGEQRKAQGINKPGKVTIVHKANVLSVSDGLFRESALNIAKEYDGRVEKEEQLVDSMVYEMILNPLRYDVVVAPNLYGDILSDAAGALVGGLGLLPSSNSGDNFTLCEPVHGSAPTIAGKGIANPIATISSVALLLEKLPFAEGSKWASYIHDAVNIVLSDPNGPKTPDLGGNSKTSDVTDAVLNILERILKNCKF